MAPLRSRVWQRYGQLRLYISGDGLDIGWYDPRTGRFELRQPTLEPEFWQAFTPDVISSYRTAACAKRRYAGPARRG